MFPRRAQFLNSITLVNYEDMRQAPTAMRPSQRLNHPKYKRKSPRNNGFCRGFIFVVAAISVVVMIIASARYRANMLTLGLQLSRSGEKVVSSSYMRNFGWRKKSDHPNKTSLYNSDGTKKRRIGYAITMTKDGHFLDGAAILAYSIYEASMKGNDIISLIAFVHPNVTTSRPTLKKLGYHVIEGAI